LNDVDLCPQQIITSYLYPGKWGPKFIPSMALNATCALGAILLAIVMRLLLQRANKALEGGADLSTLMQGEARAEDPEASDQENRRATNETFRFVT
jgi:hypothetical protein